MTCARMPSVWFLSTATSALGSRRCGAQRIIIQTSEDRTLSESDLTKLHEAEGALRALAAQMRAFAYNESIANRALQLIGFDSKKASERLFGVANTIGTTGDTRIRNKQMLTEALRLPEHTL
jgi:hypothetical protein